MKIHYFLESDFTYSVWIERQLENKARISSHQMQKLSDAVDVLRAFINVSLIKENALP